MAAFKDGPKEAAGFRGLHRFEPHRATRFAAQLAEGWSGALSRSQLVIRVDLRQPAAKEAFVLPNGILLFVASLVCRH